MSHRTLRISADGRTRPQSWLVALRSKDADTLEIAVYDVIGKSFWGDGVSAQDFLLKLRSAPTAKTVQLRINSVGGILNEAKAMVNLVRERAEGGSKVEAFVDGLAASAASYLTTAATRVVMPSNAMLMLHEARARFIEGGRAKDHDAAASLIRTENEMLAASYAEASARRGKNKSKDDYLALMAGGDTYFTASQAVEWGLADEETGPITTSACLVDIEGLDGLPEPVRSAPYVLTASAETAPTAPRIEHQPTPLPGPTPAQPGRNGETMDPKVLAKLLKLPEAATEGDITAELERLMAPVAEASAPVLRQLGASTQEAGATRAQELQRLSIGLLAVTGASTGEQALAQVGNWKQMADQTTALLKQVKDSDEKRNKAEIEAAIAKFSASGQLPPSAHEYARINCTSDAAVEQLALSLPKFGASPTETTNSENAVQLTDDDKWVCAKLGITETMFLEQKKLELKNRRGAAAQTGV